jgi:peroxin-16
MWSEQNTQYKWAARTLQFIRFTELVAEMVLRRKVSSKTRWRGVVWLEVVKYFAFNYNMDASLTEYHRALLRFVLLRLTSRPLLSPPIPERDFDPTSIPLSSNASSPTLAPSSPLSSPPATPDHLRNNHAPLPPHPLLATVPSTRSDSSVSDYLLSKAMTTSSVKPSHSLVQALSSPQDWLAESLYILRPLVYGAELGMRDVTLSLTYVSIYFSLHAGLQPALQQPSDHGAFNGTCFSKSPTDSSAVCWA